MTKVEILEELGRLKLEERLALIESAIQMIRQELKQNPEKSQDAPSQITQAPFNFVVSEWEGIDPNFTFRREDIYDDDGR